MSHWSRNSNAMTIDTILNGLHVSIEALANNFGYTAGFMERIRNVLCNMKPCGNRSAEGPNG
ncbi:MAG: hypothetical protein NVS1B7_6550 [Candidatus Saccharimonadales bacterium]